MHISEHGFDDAPIEKKCNITTESILISAKMMGLIPIANLNGEVKQQVPLWLYLQLKTKDVWSESPISYKTTHKQPFSHNHKHTITIVK